MNLYERNSTTRGARLNLKWGDNNFNVKVGGSWDDIDAAIAATTCPTQWSNGLCQQHERHVLAAEHGLPGSCDGRDGSGPRGGNCLPPRPGLPGPDPHRVR